MVGPVAGGEAGGGPAPSSSGAPAAALAERTGGALARGALARGALGRIVPSGWGAPGALGSALGSKASDRRGLGGAEPSITTGGAIATAEARRSGDGRRRARPVAEAELDVLPKFLQLFLQATLGVLQLLDSPVRLPQLLLKPVDAYDQRRRLVLLLLHGAAGHVGRRRHLRGLRRVAVEEVETLRARRRRGGRRGDDDRGQPRDKR